MFHVNGDKEAVRAFNEIYDRFSKLYNKPSLNTFIDEILFKIRKKQSQNATFMLSLIEIPCKSLTCTPEYPRLRFSLRNPETRIDVRDSSLCAIKISFYMPDLNSVKDSRDLINFTMIMSHEIVHLYFDLEFLKRITFPNMDGVYYIIQDDEVINIEEAVAIAISEKIALSLKDKINELIIHRELITMEYIGDYDITIFHDIINSDNKLLVKRYLVRVY